MTQTPSMHLLEDNNLVEIVMAQQHQAQQHLFNQQKTKRSNSPINNNTIEAWRSIPSGHQWWVPPNDIYQEQETTSVPTRINQRQNIIFNSLNHIQKQSNPNYQNYESLTSSIQLNIEQPLDFSVGSHQQQQQQQNPTKTQTHVEVMQAQLQNKPCENRGNSLRIGTETIKENIRKITDSPTDNYLSISEGEDETSTVASLSGPLNDTQITNDVFESINEEPASPESTHGTTISLSRFLQTPSIDLKIATDTIKDTLCILEKKRSEADSVFSQLFSESKEIADELNVELKAPRITSCQRNRANNHPNQSVEEYFRRSIYIPLLDSIIADLKDRLSPEVMSIFQLGVFLPKSSYTNEDLETVRAVVDSYKDLLDFLQVSLVINEFKLWITQWKREKSEDNPIPVSLPQIIELCDSKKYPNIKILLQILATLPVSAATADARFHHFVV